MISIPDNPFILISLLMSMMSQAVGVIVRNLVKDFGKLRAVNGLSFEVKPGEVLGLLGPNGAGKTTTIRILGTLLRPTSGEAFVLGYNVVEKPEEVRASLGIVFENTNFYEKLTGYENLEYYGHLYGMEGHALNSRIRELLETVGLSERANDKVQNYSRGMKQRLAIARALIHDPQVLIMDEPTATLDVPSARSMRDLIKTTTISEKKTTILCTHNMLEAQYLSTRVVIINRGSKVAEGTPEELERISNTRGLEDVFLQLIRGEPQL